VTGLGRLTVGKETTKNRPVTQPSSTHLLPHLATTHLEKTTLMRCPGGQLESSLITDQVKKLFFFCIQWVSEHRNPTTNKKVHKASYNREL